MTTVVYGLSLSLLLIIMIYKGAFSALGRKLDARGKAIASEIERGKQLRRSAQTSLRDFQRELALAERERVEIVERAKIASSEHSENKRGIISRAVDNHVRVGCERVANNKALAQQELERKILNLAVDVASDTIRNSSSKVHSEVLDQAIGRISSSL